MTGRRVFLVVVSVLAAGASLLRGQPAPLDTLFVNGKVVTVDDRFTVAQAVGVRASRIAAVGTNGEVSRLAGPATRRIDLGGKTVIPGLIDNHMHLLRAGTTWQREVRLDGVGSRAQALELLRARASTTPDGEWIYTLGGWALEQFADDRRPLTRDELDRVAPRHPVLLQASYHRSYLNSRALQVLGLEAASGDASVVRDSNGRPTGVVNESGIRGLAARLPVASGDELERSTRLMIRDLNKAGLTAFGSAGCEADVLPLYRRLAAAHALDVRVFCITGGTAGSPEQVDRLVQQIPSMKVREGDDVIDHIAYGEGLYGPLHDPMFVPLSRPGADDLRQWRRMATAVAQARLPLHVHANLTGTIDAFLDQIEAVQREHPIQDLRWTLAHVNQLNASQLARMKRLNLMAAVHPWAIINGGINATVFGAGAADMPGLQTIQQSGVVWGLGSDGSRANQILPFTTLWWAVTGKMVGGATVLRQPIDRKDALVAHTRSNARFVFRERDLGSIEAGKLADLVVLDRDYLTVAADDIRNIRPTLTMVGGRIVYDAAR
jgi:predicted amidohydrolase YtcJ